MLLVFSCKTSFLSCMSCIYLLLDKRYNFLFIIKGLQSEVCLHKFLPPLHFEIQNVDLFHPTSWWIAFLLKCLIVLWLVKMRHPRCFHPTRVGEKFSRPQENRLKNSLMFCLGSKPWFQPLVWVPCNLCLWWKYPVAYVETERKDFTLLLNLFQHQGNDSSPGGTNSSVCCILEITFYLIT